MLPALPAIGAELAVADPNDTQLVVSALLLGLGIGQLLYGPLSDSIGRKRAIYAGLTLFFVGCLMSLSARGFEWMIAGRVLQGIGVAAPRIVTVALVRDQYSGRDMARVMSFVMAVFILVPALAPALGQGILLVAGWRSIFWTFVAIAAVVLVWLALRQPETLPPERRAPLRIGRIAAAALEAVRIRPALGYTVATGLVFTPFVAYLSTAQQIFQDVYGVGERFPLYFGALALAIGSASLVNARLVMRFGMRRLCTRFAAVLALLSVAFLGVTLALDGVPPLTWLMAYLLAAFFCVGMLFGNLNALAMEPLGHIAGVGAAVLGSLSTFVSVPLGALIGQAFDGTVRPLVAGLALFAAGALAAMLWAAAGTRAGAAPRGGGG